LQALWEAQDHQQQGLQNKVGQVLLAFLQDRLLV
jgi:hypothetical protein